MSNSRFDNTAKGIFFAGTTALFWGFLSIFLKIALKEVDALSIIWIRFFTAFIFLTAYQAIKKPQELRIFRRPPYLIILAGICLGFNYIGYIKGVELAGPGTAQILIQSAQVLLVLVGIFIFKEKLTNKQLIGFFIAVVGFSLFYSESLNDLTTDRETYDLGVAFTIFGAVVWVVYAAIQKKLVAKYSAQSLNMIIYLVPSIMFLWVVDWNLLFSQSLEMWALLIFLGLNTLVAYGSLGEAFKYLEANKVSIIITLNPIITLSALTIMALLEVTIIETKIISPLAFLGGILVVFGAILAVTRRRKAKKKVT